MKRTIPLTQSAQAVCGASGTVSITIGPVRYGDVWTVTTVAVQNTSTVNVPQAVLAGAGVVQATTYTGTADSTDVNTILYQGQSISVTWTGADAGSTCTLSLYGTRDIQGG